MAFSLPILLAVGAGGAMGAVLRYITSSALLWALGPRFPWGTLTVNVLGSAAMGLAAGYFARHFTDTAPVMKAFVMVGVLGGFTTFSAFSLDITVLMERGDGALASVYILGSVILSLLALFAGLMLSRAL